MARKAVLSGCLYLPVELVDAEGLKEALTISYKPMGADEALEVEHFVESGDMLGIPRQYGLQLCRREGIAYEDATSSGHPARFPKVPQPRDYQVGVLAELEEVSDSYYDFLFRARTGWGKTIGSLILASRIGATTLIVVDQDNLKQQWIDALVKHFGFAVGDIGIIQGKKCDYRGKAVTIGMVQTMSQRGLPEDAYDYFGLVLVDEVHIIGAPTFSSILLQFSAGRRIGVSATPTRRDGLQKVLDYELGRVRVYVEDEHEESAVYVAEHGSIYSEYANRAAKVGRFITEVSDDGSRNLLLAEATAYLYDTGRDVLVLSDRIEHLKHLMSLCYYLGIPEEEMGLYTGYTPVLGYAKDPKPPRKPRDLVKYEGDETHKPGYYYTPVSLQSISKRRKAADLKSIKEGARIIFATYGKFSKGVDEPRLSAGVDATPRSQAEQVQGRILRKQDGKKKPIWITVADTASYRSLFSLTKRISDYKKSNSVVSRWDIRQGKTICDANQIERDLYAEVKRLKSMRIETNSDGLNTLVTKQQQTESVIQRVRSITPIRRASVGRTASRTVSSRLVRPAR